MALSARYCREYFAYKADLRRNMASKTSSQPSPFLSQITLWWFKSMLLFSLNLLVKFLDVSDRCQYLLSCERTFCQLFFFSFLRGGDDRRVSLPPSCSVHLRLHRTDCALPSHSSLPAFLHGLLPPLSFTSLPSPHGICPSITLRFGISAGCVGKTCRSLLVIVRLSRVWISLNSLYGYSFSTRRVGGRKIFIAFVLFALASASIMCMSFEALQGLMSQ